MRSRSHKANSSSKMLSKGCKVSLRCGSSETFKSNVEVCDAVGLDMICQSCQVVQARLYRLQEDRMTIVFDQRCGKGFVKVKERGKESATKLAGHVMQRAPDVAVSCERLATCRETPRSLTSYHHHLR